MATVALPCPMQAAEGVASTEDESVTDCCNDLATQQRTGQPCKAGQDCKVSGAALQLPELALSLMAPCRETIALAVDCLTGVQRNPIWRPPATR